MTRAVGETDGFKRLLLPGLALEAVAIGGGYATGREIFAAVYALPLLAFGAWKLEQRRSHAMEAA